MRTIRCPTRRSFSRQPMSASRFPQPARKASGTGNMKFMLNGALTLGTMDGANVEIVEEVGEENAFIFGMSSDEVIGYENRGGYNPMEIFNNNYQIRRVLMQLINGYFAPQDPELFRDIYNSLLNTQSSDRADTYFILKDLPSYAEAQKRIDQAYRNETWWAKAAILNVACGGNSPQTGRLKNMSVISGIWKR